MKLFYRNRCCIREHSWSTTSSLSFSVGTRRIKADLGRGKPNALTVNTSIQYCIIRYQRLWCLRTAIYQASLFPFEILHLYNTFLLSALAFYGNMLQGSLLEQRGWTRRPLVISSNLNHFVILWSEAIKPYSFIEPLFINFHWFILQFCSQTRSFIIGRPQKEANNKMKQHIPK